MPLGPPPASLVGFPPRRPSASLRTLYRIFWHRDPVTGVENSPWRFSAIPGGRNRFDVPVPNGTCYWSSRRYGAWVEVFRGAKVVDVSDMRARRLWTGHAPVLRLANLLAPKAYSCGVTAAISTQPDYRLPQQWAEALRLRGFEGLVGSCSHDPGSTALSVAVFGKAGTPRTQPRWRTSSARVENDLLLVSELAKFGVYATPVPYNVATVRPPP
jgi:hypothetical protein